MIRNIYLLKILKLVLLISVIFCPSILPSFAQDGNYLANKSVPVLPNWQSIYNSNENNELLVTNVPKGRKILVKSLQNIDSSMPKDTPLKFVTVAPQALISNNEPVNMELSGVIEKSSGPRYAGKSATVKIKFNKIKIRDLVYPTSAIVTKQGSKPVFMGSLATDSLYLNNLKRTANDGTITIEKVYKDPCSYCATKETSPVLRPLYYFSATALQFLDLLASPVVALLVKGGELTIPKDTVFELKLDKNMSVFVMEPNSKTSYCGIPIN